MLFYDAYEVSVEPSIDNQDDSLLNSVPDDVELLVCIVDAQFGRDPDTEDTGVQTQDTNCDTNLEMLCSLAVYHQDGYTIDDDLEKTVYLNYPEGQDDEQGVNAVGVSLDTINQSCGILLQRQWPLQDEPTHNA